MDIDIAVVGTGPAGLATALALAHGGSRVALIGPAPASPLPHTPHPLDNRTAARLETSSDMLNPLGVWEALRPHAAPLKAIRIIDATGSLFRAPEVEFRASELGLDAFGYNIPNSLLVEVLYAKAAGSVAALHPANVEHVELAAGQANLRTTQGTEISPRLVAGADGRNSICRKAAGIAASEQPYGQAAISTSFTHRAPHRGVSIEIHRQGGSVTTVPLADPASSSLIWIDGIEEIEAVMRLDEEGFVLALQDRLAGLRGQVGETGARAQFPVTRLAAESLAGRRTALVGEAAHILPPIGAQGLNLGLRDAATLADCVGDARKRSGDPGSDETLSAYDRARKIDVLTRTYGIDLLSRSLLSGFLPLQAARGIVSHGLNALPPLRRLIMRICLMPQTELPSLMRPSAH